MLYSLQWAQIQLAASQRSKLLGFAGTSYQDIQRLPPSIAEVGVLGRRSSTSVKILSNHDPSFTMISSYSQRSSNEAIVRLVAGLH